MCRVVLAVCGAVQVRAGAVSESSCMVCWTAVELGAAQQIVEVQLHADATTLCLHNESVEHVEVVQAEQAFCLRLPPPVWLNAAASLRSKLPSRSV